MNIFLSWSGVRSKQVAELLHEWIPDVLQFARTWMSAESIEFGTSWNNEIRKELKETNFGIILVTRENYDAPWLMFEAGALSKDMEVSRVVPLIADPDMKIENLTGPLTQLQAATVFSKQNLLRLFKDINSASNSNQLNPDRLQRCFDLQWQGIEKKYKSIEPADGEVPKVDSDDMLNRIYKKLVQMDSENDEKRSSRWDWSLPNIARVKRSTTRILETKADLFGFLEEFGLTSSDAEELAGELVASTRNDAPIMFIDGQTEISIKRDWKFGNFAIAKLERLEDR